jgi:unsaturated chondroitin disaccharide hydrolase
MNMENYSEVTRDQVEQALNIAVNQIAGDLDQFTHAFKINGTTNNFYSPSINRSWTSGFWTGQIWLAYEWTKDERFKKAAEVQVESFSKRMDDAFDINHHDMGFLYSLSCVAAYKLTGNQTGKEAAIQAANHLITRYQEDGQFIQAWGNVGADDNYRLIIDCLLNLPLLYWATEVTGDSKYADIAQRHIDTSLKVVLREDHSTYHTYYFEKGTGKPLYGETRQGYSDDSSWARGQAWGVYGTALSYRYTKEESYKDIFYKVTDFFLENLPKDLVPYWDFEFNDPSDESKDSSAAAIAVCGMLEMCKYLDGAEKEKYRSAALKILKSLIDHYAAKDPKTSNGLLLHGVYARGTAHNTCEDRNVDECNVWGDYFYLEALMRELKDWELYW